MTRLGKLRVGYVPSSADLKSPVDRRRFVHYAARRGVRFELADPRERYDLVVLSTLADITQWARLERGGARLVFDLPDSYLEIGNWDVRGLLRGPAKFAFRQHRHLEWSYQNSLARMCERADAVVCSTPEQRARILSLNDNVHAILDFHVDDVRERKTSYAVREPINLVWEGLAGNLFTLARIAPALRALSVKRRVVLHLITDLRYKPANGPVPYLSAQRLVDKYLRGVECALYQWHGSTFAPIATSCDLAVIPIAMDQPIHRAKAENKLLLFWRVGVPVVTSASPAYQRTMRAAGVDMIAHDDRDWEAVLDRALSEPAEARQQSAERGRRYAESEHGVERNTERWDAVVASVLDKP